MNTEFSKYLEIAGTQANAARELGVSIQSISHIVNGRRGISSQLAINIVEKYPQISLYRLLKKEEPMQETAA